MVPGTRVVYVDREEFRGRAVPHLERRGFEIRGTDTAAAALEHLEWADCVVSEYDLPDADGLELLEAVRDRDPDVPFLFCTATGSEAVASDAISAGVTDYLRKGAAGDEFSGLADSIERATAGADAGSPRAAVRFDWLVEQLAVPVYVVDPDGVVAAFNEEAASLTGYDADEVVGEHVSELLSADELEQDRADLRQLLDDDRERVVGCDVRVETADGGPVELESRVSALTRNGEFLGTVGTLRKADSETEGRLRHLHEATRGLMAETNPVEIAERTTDAAMDVIDVDNSAVYYAENGNLNSAAATDAGSGPPSFVDERTLEESFREGSPRTDPDGGGAGAAYFPLGSHGVLVVTPPEGERLDETDTRLLVVLSANAEATLDRAANEWALRQERDDLAALFENIPDPAVETRMQDDRPIVERVNPAFEETFGYTDEELRGESIDEYVVPGDREDEAAAYNERVEAGEGFQGEVKRRASDGLRDFILHVVAHDGGGTETRGYAIYTDITQQKQRERELQRQNLRIEALHGVTRRMKAATDRSEIYDIVIDAAEKILAFDICIVDEIEDGVLVPKTVGSGMSLEDYYGEAPLDRENNLGAKTARTGETLVVDDLRDSQYAPANFEYRSALSVPLDDWGIFQAVAEEEAAFSAADRQLAELLAEHAAAAINRQDRERELQERAAELTKQNERLDKFASIVSHDLRNPLSVARGRLDLARATGDDEHYRAVERAHKRMDELVSGLLTLARQGELKSNPVSVELRSAAVQAWQTVETDDLELVTDDAPAVEADPERLRQLLENLFTNTVEHGDVATTITVGRLDDGFYVADDGSGIPAEEREGIFESGQSGTEEGTGLGLVIVETVAEAHGWTVSATESEAGGARFEFRDASDEPAA